MRQVLVKVSPALKVVPSGTVTSATKSATSQVCTGLGRGVLVEEATVAVLVAAGAAAACVCAFDVNCASTVWAAAVKAASILIGVSVAVAALGKLHATR